MSGGLRAIENWQRAGFGIYVHWPFCAAKCPYCDFNSHVSRSIDHDDWLSAYLVEIDRYAAEVPDRVVSSIFFGGGTPSLMQPETVARIIDRISKDWTLANDVEITLEANPTSTEADRFQAFRSAGINRVSVGVQALNDKDLSTLGRMHTADEALAAVEIAATTFERTSFDLIYARQGQSLKDWDLELHHALSFKPTHLSLYQLTIEDGTAFGDRHRRGLLRGLPDEDLSADLYELTQDICTASGLDAYEVSNHAVAGNESRHNLIYWRGGDYLGIGPGAHGRIGVEGLRYATETTLSPSMWLENVKSKRGEAKRTALTAHEVASERLVMGLRISEGVCLADIPSGVLSQTGLADMRNAGLVTVTDGYLKTTQNGRPVLNSILREITV
jgi:oxygen-independent coproporphyrinogen-3 oxidase